MISIDCPTILTLSILIRAGALWRSFLSLKGVKIATTGPAKLFPPFTQAFADPGFGAPIYLFTRKSSSYFPGVLKIAFLSPPAVSLQPVAASGGTATPPPFS